MLKEEEIWLPVVGYEGFYEVSNQMRVRSVERIVTCVYGSKRRSPSKILKPSKTTDGYQAVDLSMNGVRKHKNVHRLVAEAFIPNPDNLPEVDHIIPLINGGTDTIDNLRWVSKKGNANNPMSLENRSKAQLNVSARKSKSMKGKLDKELLQYDLNHNLINTYYGILKTCVDNGWNSNTIFTAIHKKQKAYGFYWEAGKRVNIQLL